jgi:hypothetical protein
MHILLIKLKKKKNPGPKCLCIIPQMRTSQVQRVHLKNRVLSFKRWFQSVNSKTLFFLRSRNVVHFISFYEHFPVSSSLSVPGYFLSFVEFNRVQSIFRILTQYSVNLSCHEYENFKLWSISYQWKYERPLRPFSEEKISRLEWKTTFCY